MTFHYGRKIEKKITKQASEQSLNCIIADGGQVWPNAISSPIIKTFSNLRLQGEWHMITALHGGRGWKA